MKKRARSRPAAGAGFGRLHLGAVAHVEVPARSLHLIKMQTRTSGS